MKTKLKMAKHIRLFNYHAGTGKGINTVTDILQLKVTIYISVNQGKLELRLPVWEFNYVIERVSKDYNIPKYCPGKYNSMDYLQATPMLQ